MSGHQTLYRKYRPRKFEDVIGQPVVKGLQKAVTDKRVAHAYLLSGTRGSGKTTTARILAAALNCENVSEIGEPCGDCLACEMTFSGVYPDVIKEVDAASNNGVNDVRALTATIGLSTMAPYRIYIIDEVHMLTTAASNALLKTLEEPPPNVVFILATTDPQKLLPTILSRTVHLKFNDLKIDELEGLVSDISIKEKLDISGDILHNIAVEAQGSARNAVSLLESAAMGVNPGTNIGLQRVQDALIERSAADALLVIAELATDSSSGGFDPLSMADRLISFMRNALIFQHSPEIAENFEFLDQIKILAGEIPGSRLVRDIDTIADSRLRMRDGVNNRTLLEVAILKIVSPTARAKEDGYISAVEDLSGRILHLEQSIEELKSFIGKSGISASASTEEKEAVEVIEEAPEPVVRKKRVREPEPEVEEEVEEAEEATEDSNEERDVVWDSEDAMYDEWSDMLLLDGFGTKSKMVLESAELEYVAEDGLLSIAINGKITSIAMKKLVAYFEEKDIEVEVVN